MTKPSKPVRHEPAPAGQLPRLAADVFVDCLESEGVEYVFGIPG